LEEFEELAEDFRRVFLGDMVVHVEADDGAAEIAGGGGEIQNFRSSEASNQLTAF
jgi:hypothetical protein